MSLENGCCCLSPTRTGRCSLVHSRWRAASFVMPPQPGVPPFCRHAVCCRCRLPSPRLPERHVVALMAEEWNGTRPAPAHASRMKN